MRTNANNSRKKFKKESIFSLNNEFIDGSDSNEDWSKENILRGGAEYLLLLYTDYRGLYCFLKGSVLRRIQNTISEM